MGDYGYWIAGAVIILVAVVVFKVKSVFDAVARERNKHSEEFYQSISLTVLKVIETGANGTVQIDGIVENGGISVGETYQLLDSEETVVTNDVVIERIECLIRGKLVSVDAADPGTCVDISVRTSYPGVIDNMFLKKRTRPDVQVKVY